MPYETVKGKTYKGRLILDEVNHGDLIETVDADPIMGTAKDEKGKEYPIIIKSAWRIAREKINDLKFVHEPNTGWFVPDEKKVTA
jgi:hypothetical protein